MQAAFLTKATHQPFALTCLPPRALQGAHASAGLTAHSAQLAQTLPLTYCGHLFVSIATPRGSRSGRATRYQRATDYHRGKPIADEDVGTPSPAA